VGVSSTVIASSVVVVEVVAEAAGAGAATEAGVTSVGATGGCAGACCCAGDDEDAEVEVEVEVALASPPAVGVLANRSCLAFSSTNDISIAAFRSSKISLSALNLTLSALLSRVVSRGPSSSSRDGSVGVSPVRLRVAAYRAFDGGVRAAAGVLARREGRREDVEVVDDVEEVDDAFGTRRGGSFLGVVRVSWGRDSDVLLTSADDDTDVSLAVVEVEGTVDSVLSVMGT
jgi:hypothetical protein